MKRKKKMKRYKIQYLSININLINFIKKIIFPKNVNIGKTLYFNTIRIYSH